MLSDRQFGTSDFRVSPVGLGCSRLGSVLGASMEDSVDLIHLALDEGIRFFDTSDIYAQGDSEILLGRVLGSRRDAVVCTKVGKRLSPAKRLLLPFKSLIRSAAGVSVDARRGVRAARSKPMPTCFESAYLAKAIDRSLKRLARDRIDVMMLHSPTAEIVRRGEAIDVLDTIRRAGKIGVIGVSCDDVETAELALRDTRIGSLQLPLHPHATEYAAVIAAAASQGVAVVAREILGGPNAIHVQRLEADAVFRRVVEACAMPGVSVSLIGTTRAAHLREALHGLR